MEKRVVALLTMLISLLAVYQRNCLVIILNITTFQRWSVVLSRAMDSALGPIWRFFSQLRRAYSRHFVRPRPMRAWWNNILSGAAWWRMEEEFSDVQSECLPAVWRTVSFIEKQTTVMCSPQPCYAILIPSTHSFIFHFILSIHSFIWS